MRRSLWRCPSSVGATVCLFLAEVAILRTAPTVWAADENSDVIELTEENFESTVNKHKLVFVEFYAPWCGHCKELAPKWEKTATQAKEIDPPLPVAKVDAIASKELAGRHEVRSFPTLRLFRGVDASVIYNGPRTPEKMVDWLRTWSEAEMLEKLKSGGIKSWGKRKTVSLIGLAPELGDEAETASMRAALEGVAFSLNPQKPQSEVPSGFASATDVVLKELGLERKALEGGSAVVMLRQFDFEDPTVVFTKKSSSEGWKGLSKWVTKVRQPTLIPASSDTERFFLHDIQPKNAILFFFGGSSQLKKAAHQIAVEKKSDATLKCVYVNTADSYSESMGKTVGLTNEQVKAGEMILWEFGESEDDDKFFLYSKQSGNPKYDALDGELIRKFISDWKDEKLVTEKDPVVAVTSDSFEKVVFDKSKDTLVEFYAPWCGHCKQLAPVYKQLAKHYADDPGIGIVKMDATKHKHESAEVKAYPTLKFYTKGSEKPMNVEFKANRDLQSLIEFVDENRSSKAPTKKDKAKKKEAKDAEPKKEQEKEKQKSAKKEAEAEEDPAYSRFPIVVVDSGVWVYDDASDSKRRGHELSKKQMRSEGGHSLVTMRDRGLLLHPDGKALAVRAFANKEEAKKFREDIMRKAAEAAVAEMIAPKASQTPPPPASWKSGRAPCPEDADTWACQAWCEQVSPSDTPALQLKGAKGGKSCKEVKKGDQSHQYPQCMCYDQSFQHMMASCMSDCPGKKLLGDATEDKKEEKKEEKHEKPEKKDEKEPEKAHAKKKAREEEAPKTKKTGLAVDATGDIAEEKEEKEEKEQTSEVEFGAGQFADFPDGKRWLLYDTKYGEGFSLQREVFPRAAWIVAELNRKAKERCGDDVVSPGCPRWSLVLPPWCRVVHWNSPPDHVNWREFFDRKALNGSEVPTVEFEDYKKAAGGKNKVDMALVYTVDKEAKKDQVFFGDGDFSGWTKEIDNCAKVKGEAGKRVLGQYEFNEKNKEYSIDYSGFCDGRIKAVEMHCGVLRTPFPEAVVDMMETIPPHVGSVYIRGYDYLLPPDAEKLDKLRLREAMLFSPELRKRGDDFIKKVLGGKPYLAAHMRRTDFLRVRKATTPTLEDVAAKLMAAAKEQSVDRVFIATDGDESEKTKLRDAMKGSLAVHFYDKKSGGSVYVADNHPGKQAAVETWICARADFFVGTADSRFTSAIQLERGFLDKKKETSEQEFCKEAENVEKVCKSPHYRHPGRKGTHRKEYQK